MGGAGGKVVDRNSEKGALCHLQSMERILQATTFVHALPAIHGDIKLDNILVKLDGTPVLADFDLSRNLAGLDQQGGLGAAVANLSATTRAGAGTEYYMPPEVKLVQDILWMHETRRPNAQMLCNAQLTISSLQPSQPYHRTS